MDRPVLLAVATSLFWAGNAVAGRLAVDQITPAQLTLLRWLIAGSIMLPLTARQLAAAWPLLRRRIPYLAAMGALGFTAYNVLFYAAAHSTTAINIAILSGATPVLVLAGARVVFGMAVAPLQWLGAAVALCGVLAVASGGSLANLAGLEVNRGDLIVFAANVFYAGYSLGLRARPAVGPLVFFAAIVPAAVASALVPAAVELAAGRASWPTLQGLAVLAYVGLFPSLLAQVFFVRAVDLIGAARTGLFTNLIPIFAAGLAWLVLGERPGWHHAVGLALVLAGLALSERAARRAPATDRGGTKA